MIKEISAYTKSLIKDYSAYNKNIKLAMISSIFLMASNGLVMSAIFSIFVKAIGGGSDAQVGFVSLFGGIILLIVILPGGIIADKFTRKASLRIGLVFLFLGYVFFYLSNTLFDIYLAFGLINVGNGFVRPSREALVADSVVNFQREKIYGEIYFLQQVSNGIGPLFAVFLFLYFGDNWQVSTLKEVIFFGLFGILVGVIILYFMDDKYSLGNESESDYLIKNGNGNGENGTFKTKGFLQGNELALFVVFLGLIIGVGAGMTVRFFPIFFEGHPYNLPPTVVNFVYFLVAVLTGIMGIVVTKSVGRVGKVESIIIVQVIAIICLLTIALIPPLVILIPIFIIRGSFMNSSQPVKSAIIMDLVPKKNRGLFQSLQVLTQNFFWSLSAGVGGVLLETYNFPVLFISTAIIYVFGTLPFILVLKKIPNNRVPRPKKANVTPVI